MTSSYKQAQAEIAKLMAAACVRRGYLEKLHAGIGPVTRSGDYSDVKVIDAEGREIPWNEVSHIDQEQMKTLNLHPHQQNPEWNYSLFPRIGQS